MVTVYIVIFCFALLQKKNHSIPIFPLQNLLCVNYRGTFKNKYM